MAKYWGFNDDTDVFARMEPARPVSGYATNRWKTPVDTVQYVKDVGANAQRFQCFWAYVEQSPNVDRAIYECCKRGETAIVHLSGSTGPDPVEYRYKVAQAAARWPGVILEAWNEPNVDAFGDLTSAQTAELNDAAAQAAPGRVISSAIAPQPPEKVDDPDGYFAYNEEMFDRMEHKDKLRGAAIHFLPPWYDPEWQLERAISRTHEWSGNKPIFATEWGLHKSVYTGVSTSQPGQASATLRLIAKMAKDPRVGGAFWHRLVASANPVMWERDEKPSGFVATREDALTYALHVGYHRARGI